jgi:HTH-type transcriptional regulator / antitoxin HigA
MKGGHMELKPITNKSAYETSLAELDRLMDANPKPGTAEANQVLLLAVLIEKYEKDRFTFEQPTAIEAIQFRMEEQGLDRNDLIPFIGSKSKVSEVLSSKRPLSLNMVKSISKGLGISADILLNGVQEEFHQTEVDSGTLPVKEMLARGWIKSTSQSILQQFVAPLMNLSPQVLFRKSGTHVTDKSKGLLIAWLSRVLNLSYKIVPLNKGQYRKEFITKTLLREVASLSYLDRGPLLAIELLGKNGVVVIAEEYLKGLKLDGASLLRADGVPVVGISLRYDRIDNFWFTLLHELAHVFKHLSATNPLFYDDLDKQDVTEIIEKEADFIAKDAFVPLNIWKNSSVLKDRSKESVLELSRRMRIHPGIIVGRLQRELRSFQIMRDLLEEGTVRKMLGSS